ncbi:hypothetical protein K435DRAFT_766628 [Dendrothele bispora CBS 962.96]|uniref:Uncharacterized protein n=1 Tax=Dendrothele bispora (strain CBS 962.96) TaxID=1314807 RepID=A0A4V4HC85_DENBC|nr:hypothetical protein K435DRAFT_766628 [Dendrothele bispora CBS 962.96]
MGRTKVTKNPEDKKKVGKGTKKHVIKSNEPKRHSELCKEILENVKRHGKSEKTNKLYAGHVKRGKEWVKKYATMQTEVEEAYKAQRAAGGMPVEEDLEAGAELDPDFADCLDGAPLECTPTAIAMYMHDKCFGEGCGKSTVDQLHAAFLLHYNTMKGNKYHESRRFQKDEVTREWVGNPVCSPEVEQMLKTCHNKNGEADRNHTRPITMGDLQRIWAYAKIQCPDDLDASASLEHLALKTKWLFWKAYSSTGMTVWTRNNETSLLKRKHIILNPAPHPSGKEQPVQCFELNLKGRKGWQNKMSKNEHQLNGHKFMICPQPNTPWACMYTHILNWIAHYETYFHRLDDEDYIFPAFNATWTSFKRQEPISSKSINTLINETAEAAQVKGAGEFTTHCFRRGGAQYRFMYAPVGERWTLARIRWWGGWAEGEHRDTLIRYLLDELHTYEEDHSNALLLGFKIDGSVKPDSEHTQSSLLAELANSVQSLETTMSKLHSQQGQIMNPIGPQFDIVSHFPVPANPNYYTPFQYSNIIPQSIPYPSPSSQYQHTTGNTSFHPSILYNPTSAVPVGPSTTTHAQLAALSISELASPPQFFSSAASIPVIPAITRSNGSRGWKIAVQDWQYADPSRGLTRALKDWPKEWSSEIKRKVHYGQRRMIAEEFLNEYNGDEQAFCTAYPEHKDGITALVNAIRKTHQASGLRQTRRSKGKRS